ncbi:MAG: ligase-associated DNA damage response endonuclease PdeM [Bacteroidota bacterium]
MRSFEFSFKHQNLVLDPLKAIFWVEQSLLILSDLHLGKAGHFRKNGIAVPVDIHQRDLINLNYLIDRYQPKTIAFLGDLFHSDLNAEWNTFSNWMGNQRVEMILVKGNHDILSENIYKSSKMKVCDDLMIEPFHFSHEQKESALYNISGHVHPSIRLRGRAKQGVTIPCFYFSKDHGLLPAYGAFTGTYKIRPVMGDHVFATTGEEVIAIMPQKA